MEIAPERSLNIVDCCCSFGSITIYLMLQYLHIVFSCLSLDVGGKKVFMLSHLRLRAPHSTKVLQTVTSLRLITYEGIF